MLVEEIDRAVVSLVDVLEIGGRLGHRAVDRRLEVGVEPERLREAAVLGTEGVPAGHQPDEVVLDRAGAVLRREGRRRLAGARQADDHEDLVALRRRDDLEPGVQREAALVVDDVVPHPQPALLGLTEVVRVEDARRVVVEVDGDHTVVGIALGAKTRGVDHLDFRFPARARAVVTGEVELLLHPGDVRVPLFHDQPSRGAHVRVVADVAVDHQHVVLGHVGVLGGGDSVVVGARHRLAARGAVHDIRRSRGTGQHLGLDVDVAELADASLGHLFGECPQLLGGWVVGYLCHGWPPRSVEPRRRPASARRRYRLSVSNGMVPHSRRRYGRKFKQCSLYELIGSSGTSPP